MEIKIKDDGEEVILTNEGYDNDNFVALIVKDDDDNVTEVTVPVSELYAAVGAFMSLRRERLKTDQLRGKD